MSRPQFDEEEEEEELEEIDIDSIEDEKTLIDLLDEAEDIDERKRIRDRLRKVQFVIKADREKERRRREDEREQKIRNRVKEADEKKKQTLAKYKEMTGPPETKRFTADDHSASPTIIKPRDLVEDAIRGRVKYAEDRKKRIMAAYDHAAKTQPAGQARIVEFDAFRSADVTKLDAPKPLPRGSCCFGMSGGVVKLDKVAPVAKPEAPVDESELDPMERAIRARVREANERKKRTLAAYDIVARTGGGGPKVVFLEEFKDLDVSKEPKKEPRYDPCFRGGLKA